jgi:hypothetical protein
VWPGNQVIGLCRIDAEQQPTLAARADGHIAADQERQATEHAFLRDARLVLKRLTQSVREFLVICHGGSMACTNDNGPVGMVHLMHAVVNHLHFRDDVDPSLFAGMAEVVPQMRAINGFGGIHVIQTAAKEVTLVILAADAETLDRLATEVGSPWMVANLVPLLAGPPERQLGPVLASG